MHRLSGLTRHILEAVVGYPDMQQLMWPDEKEDKNQKRNPATLDF